MYYDDTVIVAKSFDVMAVPLGKCMGVDFGSHPRKPVSYKARDYMLCDWNEDMCQRLANAGMHIPLPALFDYNWPGPFTPYAHQRTTFNFILANKRSFVFNDIGTAKTLTALWAADYLLRTNQIKRVLVTSTLSTLERVWMAEVFKHLMKRKAVVIHGTAKKRKRAIETDCEFHIINHDGLKTERAALVDKKYDMVIVDEGAKFRNQKTALWNALYDIANEEVLERLVWMTGSPMPNSPTDVWAQARIVNPQTVPRYFSHFRDKTMFKVNQFKYVPMKGWEEIVYSTLKPSIRFHRDECLDLPPCVYVDHEVPMTAQQTEAYMSLHKHFIADLQAGVITAVNEGAKLIKLLQLACGAIYHDDGSISELDCSTKKDELDSILEEAGYKVILYAPFKNTIPVITKHLDTKHETLSYGVVNGDVGTTKRNKIFSDFQEGDLNVIVAHPAAMAHGLTLTESNTIVWWAPVDDYEIYEQANGRITRPGQVRKQNIRHLFCSDIERAVYGRLKRKESMQGLILDMIKK